MPSSPPPPCQPPNLPHLPSSHPRRARAKKVLKGQEEASAGADLPANAHLLHSTLGVTSEGFQDALTLALWGGLMLPPDPEGLGAAHKAAAKRARAAAAKGGEGTRFKYMDAMGELRAGGDDGGGDAVKAQHCWADAWRPL